MRRASTGNANAKAELQRRLRNLLRNLNAANTLIKLSKNEPRLRPRRHR